jgi:hypothetical protein
MSSSSDSHDDDPADSGPAYSRDAVTPRGGFMARPGLKVPPRHAVVVRVGDAPESEHIPLARPSVPPPPPASEPAPVSASEKITLRAIPTPSTPPPNIESMPPPSDAPFAASVRSPDSSVPSSRRRNGGSSWTIALAAAAGLLLGLASVVTRAHGPERAAQALPASPSPIAAQQPAPAHVAAAAAADATPPTESPAAAAAPSSAAAPNASVELSLAKPNGQRLGHRPDAAPRPSGAAGKRPIF